MNQLIVRKNYPKWVIIRCPLCFWAALSADLSWYFASFLGAVFPSLYYQGRFGNPFIPPQHMSLMEMICLMLKHFPFVGTRKVHRTVGISIKNYVIQVDVKIAAWITDPDVLYSLALFELNCSPSLKGLPRWMRREISKKARCIKLVSTSLPYGKVCARQAIIITLPEGKPIRTERLVSGAEIISVSRSLIWKGSADIARKITQDGLPLTAEEKRYLLSSMHPMCREIADMANTKAPLLGMAVVDLLTTLGLRYPCFFFTEKGSRMLSAVYGAAGFIRILRITRRDLSCLIQQVRCFWQGNIVPVGLKWAGSEGRREYLRSLLPDTTVIQDGLPDGSCHGVTAPGLVGPAEEDDTTEGIQNSAAPTEAVPPLDPDHCTCNCEGQQHNASTDKKKMTADMGISAPDAVDGPACGSSSKDELLKMLAASYVRATGAQKAPLIVLRASDLDNSQTSSKRRRINRYNGNIPALAIEAMMEVFDVMFPGFYITDFVRATDKGGKDTIYLHTNSSEVTCPCCGQKSKKAKDGNTRTVQDISLRNEVGLQLELTVGRGRCDNKECAQKGAYNYEHCSFVQPYKRYTTRVEYLALVTGVSSSFHDTERQLRLMGIQFGDDCVKNLLMSLEFEDEVDVTIAGMDDVSIRKGQTYCTIIYNLANGHVLKLIEGRGGVKFEKELTRWLDQHPYITTICRDRASSYGCYIDRYCRYSHRTIRQVADRFHLLQNLSDHLRDVYYPEIPYRLTLSKDDQGSLVISEEVPQMVAIPNGEKPEGMADWKYDNTPVDSEGMPIRIEICVDRVPERKKAARIENKTDLFERFKKAREDYAVLQGFAYGEKKKFLDEHEISVYQFQKYVVEMEQDEFDRQYEQSKGWNPSSRPKLFDDYKNLVYKMLKDGHDIMETYWYIKEVVGGWNLADSTLVDYIMETYKQAFPDEPLPLKEELIRMAYPDEQVVIGRTKLFYALMTLDEKKKDEKITPYLDLICEKYPACKSIRSINREFHDIIIVDKDINKRTPEKCEKALKDLTAFIDKHKEGKLSGFANSLQSDIICVTNAITMPYSSGGVEGRNCKYKEVLRSCYGHIPLETLEQKLKLEFMYTGKDFTFSGIAPWLVSEMPA